MNTPEKETPVREGEQFLKQLDAALDGQTPSGQHADLAAFGARLKQTLNDSEAPAENTAPDELRERLNLKLQNKKPVSNVVKLDRKLSRYRLGILDIAALVAVAVLGALIWNALKTPAVVSKKDPQPTPVADVNLDKKERAFAAEDEKEKAAETNPKPTPPAKNEDALPKIEATVLAVQRDKQLVMLDVGNVKGVAVGDTFAVRKEDSVVTMMIDRVYPDMCSAKIVQGSKMPNISDLATLTGRGPLPEKKPAYVPVAEPETDLDKKLKRAVSFEFVDSPLDEALGFIREISGTQIIIDPKVVADGPKPVSLRVQDMSLKSALNWISRLSGTRASIRDNVVFISKPEHEPLELRIYDVSDLKFDAPALAKVVKGMAFDTGFDRAGTSIEANQDKLVVNQTTGVHEEIRAVLAAARANTGEDRIDFRTNPARKADIQKKLERKVTFEFVDVSMTEALDFFRKVCNVNFAIDPKIAADGAPLINLRVTDMNMSHAIEWLLQLADCNHELRDEALYVFKGEPRPVCIAYNPKKFLEASKLTIEEAATKIRTHIAPGSWDESKGRKVQALNGWLAVYHSERVHEDVEEWLFGKAKKPEQKEAAPKAGKAPAPEQKAPEF